jgi:hypothetical protein
MGIHLAGEHALEFQALDIQVQAVRIRFYLPDRAQIGFA